MRKKTIQLSIVGITFCLTGSLQASEFIDLTRQQASEFIDLTQQQASALFREAKTAINAIDIYRTPQVPHSSAKDKAMNCRELEQEMRSTIPNTYSYTPNFYDNSIKGGAFWASTFYAKALYVAWYNDYIAYKETRRIIPAEDRIETLRQLKAEKRCFER